MVSTVLKDVDVVSVRPLSLSVVVVVSVLGCVVAFAFTAVFEVLTVVVLSEPWVLVVVEEVVVSGISATTNPVAEAETELDEVDVGSSTKKSPGLSVEVEEEVEAAVVETGP